MVGPWKDHYQNHYGFRARSNWGQGDILAPYAEGDVVNIPAGCKAFDGRIPHQWSEHPELCKPGLYRIISSFSIGEGDDWYFRVAPIVDGKTMWDETSDRIHVMRGHLHIMNIFVRFGIVRLDGNVDYTEGWTLIRPAKRRGAT